MDKDSEIIIGGSHQNRLRIRVIRRSHPECTDYWDANWQDVLIELDVGAFEARITGDLRAEEFVGFHNELTHLYDTLAGAATFRTLEGWIELVFSIDKMGHILLKGMLLDDPGIGNRLTFRLDLDQSYLPDILRALDDVNARFPVIGFT